MSSAVVLPTFNESEKVREMVQALLGLRMDMAVVIVDDDSPDGTAALPRTPDSRMMSASTVGLPRESMISRA